MRGVAFAEVTSVGVSEAAGLMGRCAGLDFAALVKAHSVPLMLLLQRALASKRMSTSKSTKLRRRNQDGLCEWPALVVGGGSLCGFGEAWRGVGCGA